MRHTVLYERVSLDKTQKGIKALSQPKPGLQRSAAAENQPSRTQRRLEALQHQQQQTQRRPIDYPDMKPSSSSAARQGSEAGPSGSPRHKSSPAHSRGPRPAGHTVTSSAEHHTKDDRMAHGSHVSSHAPPDAGPSSASHLHHNSGGNSSNGADLGILKLRPKDKKYGIDVALQPSKEEEVSERVY